MLLLLTSLTRSLSARRAWIEILRGWTLNINGPVALRKESVDRNATSLLVYLALMVALRKESVDRNDSEACPSVSQTGRSPQGERG